MKRKQKHLQKQRQSVMRKKSMKAKTEKEYKSEAFEGAPFSLFQGDDGRWGVKDKDGNVAEYPDMILQEHQDGIPTFFDGETTVCGFSPDEGFYLISWFDPEEFPDLYNAVHRQEENGD